MKNTKISTIIISIISCFIPILFTFILKYKPLINSFSVYIIIWVFLNYTFLTVAVEKINSTIKLFKLKNLQVNKPLYLTSILDYALFFIWINFYFIRIMYIDNNIIINILGGFEFAGLILLLFLINVYSGIFPVSEDLENSTIFNIREKESLKFGREKFGTTIGDFDEGIIVGYIPYYYDDMTSIYYDKKLKALVIKGKNKDIQYRINISAPKSKEIAEKILNVAKENNKINNKIWNK